MSRYVLVVAELREGALRQVSLEAVAAARMVAGEDGTVAVYLAGHHPQAHTGELHLAGTDRIFAEELAAGETVHTERLLQSLVKIAASNPPAAVVLGHTALGRDIAPRLAARLDAGQLSDVIAITPEQGTLAFTRPIYAGKAFEKRIFLREPWVVTIRPNNFPCKPERSAAEEPESASCAVEAVPAPDSGGLRTVIREVVRRTAGKTDLAEAKMIVSGGRGVKSADGFRPLAELADVLGGAVGASRGACDAGYCDYALQIGQTGKVVTPELYIACGISGAIQHVAGMSGSRVIVAINKDPEAPIFKIADYGIVGDLFEVVPLLTEEFKRQLSPE
ncbi:MAG: electron transfer flavodomain protein [Paenibacillus sp.]|jgi:electron transfer flavoprotein alpha subunit|uniref:electron transfer flavoprotein subunit alpha/FixB family protein n=1 Tax=Paenibacillus sp. GCM10012303 TaxID=3317340 RepID=UPI0029F3DE78|nr:electron transfer flavodomain protein [Paenibacillus sp.]